MVILSGERVLARVEAERLVVEPGAVLRCAADRSLVLGARKIEWQGEVRIDCPSGDVTIGAADHTFAPGARVHIESPRGWVRFIAWHTTGEPRIEAVALQADIDPDRTDADMGALVTTRVRRSLLARMVAATPEVTTVDEPKVHFAREKWHALPKARLRQGYLARLALDAAGRNLTVTSGSDRAAGAHEQGRAIDVVGPGSFGERLRMAARLSRALGDAGLVLVEEVDPRPRAGAPDGYQCNVGFKAGVMTSVKLGVRYPPDLKRKRQSSPYHATRSHLHVTMYRGKKVPKDAPVVQLDLDVGSERAGRAAYADAE